MQLIRGKYMKNLYFLKIVKLLVVFLKECAEGDNNWCGMYFIIVVVMGNLKIVEYSIYQGNRCYEDRAVAEVSCRISMIELAFIIRKWITVNSVKS